MEKKIILSNYKFALLDNETRHFVLLKDEEDVQRVLSNDQLFDSDLIIKLTKDNLRVAIKRNFIELK